MEERPAETNANVDNSASPSVAQLAGRFREQAAAAKEANLTFDPAALLPGASPKSPGLKAMVSPFHSPPSTPSSPGVRSRPSEAEEVPVSFDQPPEGSHLPCYNKVRTRGSIKRRPPSRRFRRSQSDCGELGDFRAAESSQENGAKEEDGDEVFPSKSKAPGSPSSSEGAAGEGVRTLGPAEKPPLRRSPSRTEKQEEDRATEEAKNGEKARRSSEDVDGQHPAQEEAPKAPQTSGPEAENRCGSPREEKPAGEEAEMEKAAEVKEETVQNEEAGPEHESQETKKPEEGAAGKETPHSPPGGVKGGDVPKQEKGKEKQQEGAVLEPGCSPQTAPDQLETSSEVQSERAVPRPEVGGLARSHAEVSARTWECICHMPCSVHPFINQLNLQKQRCQAPASCQLVGERLLLRLRGQKDTKGKCVLCSCQLLADLGVLASFWVCVE
uniref:RCSD domain containing 1 n=1 Tax=Macaca fascicularis TaxID=9541 RepID=A0A7N9DCU6_MACFA